MRAGSAGEAVCTHVRVCVHSRGRLMDGWLSLVHLRPELIGVKKKKSRGTTLARCYSLSLCSHSRVLASS